MFSKKLYKLASTFYGIVGTGKRLEEIDTVLILGGSNSLGKDICATLFSNGVKIINVDAIDSLALGKNYTFVHCKDFANTMCVQKAMLAVKSLESPVTVLLNNVQKNFESIYDSENEQTIFENSADQLRECVTSNLTNVMIATKLFLKEIVPQTVQLTEGKIRDYYVVNLSTLLTLHVPERASNYVSSKAALNQFHDALTSEFKCNPSRTKIKTLLVFLPDIKEWDTWECLTPYLSRQLVQCLQDGRRGDVLLRADDSPLTACKVSDSTNCRFSNILPKWKQ